MQNQFAFALTQEKYLMLNYCPYILVAILQGILPGAERNIGLLFLPFHKINKKLLKRSLILGAYKPNIYQWKIHLIFIEQKSTIKSIWKSCRG